MASPFDRFRAAERAPLISPAERQRNEIFRATNPITPLTQRGRDVKPASPAPELTPQLTTAGVAQGPFQYPTVLPPLSPEAQRAFEERRRLATQAYQETTAANERQRVAAEAAAVQGRREVARQQGEESRAGMTQLAARGVARSPMFANPFQRGVARVAQQRVGELEMGLAGTLENLRTALQSANTARERELADIEADMLAMRSNVPALLGIG